MDFDSTNGCCTIERHAWTQKGRQAGGPQAASAPLGDLHNMAHWAKARATSPATSRHSYLPSNSKRALRTDTFRATYLDNHHSQRLEIGEQEDEIAVCETGDRSNGDFLGDLIPPAMLRRHCEIWGNSRRKKKMSSWLRNRTNIRMTAGALDLSSRWNTPSKLSFSCVWPVHASIQCTK